MCSVLERGAVLDDGLDVLLGDHRGEPVGAEEVDVAVAARIRERLDFDARLGAERARDDRTLGVVLGLLGAQAALPDQLLDQRVILGQPLETPVAQPVEAAVPDVANRNVPPRDHHGRQRRPHPGALAVPLRHLVDPAVRLARHSRELLLGRAFRRPVGERLDGDARRHLPGACSAHAVRHSEQRRPLEVRVLVALPLPADVGEARLFRYLNRHSVTPGSGTRYRRFGSHRTAAAARGRRPDAR